MHAPPDPCWRTGIVGSGRAGLALARALRDAGHHVAAVTARDADAPGRVRDLLGDDVATHEDAGVLAVRADLDLIVLAVPDDSLDGVVREIADAVRGGGGGSAPGGVAPMVLHVSGVRDLVALAPLADLGWRVATLHPLRPLARATGPGALDGAMAAISAGDPATLDRVDRLARELGMDPFVLHDQAPSRDLYHAAASIAANYTVTLQQLANELALAAGMPPQAARAAMLDLARHALDDVERCGPGRALTGPVARGDVGTVRRHLVAVAQQSSAIEQAYRAVGACTLDLALGDGRLTGDPAVVGVLRELLEARPRSTEGVAP